MRFVPVLSIQSKANSKFNQTFNSNNAVRLEQRFWRTLKKTDIQQYDKHWKLFLVVNNTTVYSTHHDSLTVTAEIVFQQPREHGVSVRDELVFVGL